MTHDRRPSPVVASGERPASAAYHDERLGYAFDVPAVSASDPSPADDDGRVFRAPDAGATLTMSGYNGALGDGLDGLADRARDGIDAVPYDARPAGGVARSATSGDTTVAARGLYREGAGVLARLATPDGSSTGDEWAERVGESLR